MLYAYVPSPSSKERKQIRLDCLEKLMETTKNDFRLYEDIIALMGNECKRCPCELIADRLSDNIAYSESIKNKNFDSKPSKLKKEPIDAILFKYSINWKSSLNKKKLTYTSKSKPKQQQEKSVDTCIEIDERRLTASSLTSLNGRSVKRCNHEFVTRERQLRAGDEIVSFVHFCKYCGRNK